jgi:hypothetical protein
MKRKVFLFLFLFIIIIDSTSAVDQNTSLIDINSNENSAIETIDWKNYNNTELNNKQINKWLEKNKSINSVDDKNKLIYEKKILKKEIRKRRVYHKNLLNMYNVDFDNNNLELITHNWLLINNLEKYYKLNFT